MLGKRICLIAVVFVIGLAGNVTVVRATDWTGAAGDGNWMNPANWSPILPGPGERVDIESATPLIWPMLDGGTVTCGEVRIAYVPSSVGELTVTGGATLNVVGELRLGRQEGVPLPTGRLYIGGEGTSINVTQLIECGRYGNGIIDMTGGYLHSDAELRLAYRDGSSGTVYLRGGTIDLAGNPGITVTGGGNTSSALIDISGKGAFKLAGNQVSLVETLVSGGIILAGGGKGTVLVTYDGFTTTVVATGLVEEKATSPSPEDGQTDVPRSVVLSWTPGEYAPSVNGHKVYFSENFNDVNEGIGGIAQDANSYTPAQRLDFGRTYYWRVDELSAPPETTIFKGDVWSFVVEPFAYPMAGDRIAATASSSNSPGEGPKNTVNGSGLDADDAHSIDSTAMWLSSITGPQPTWIQHEFDEVYKLHQMVVWNHNTSAESGIGFGIKEATIEYSTDGMNWATLGTTHEFARASGSPGYAANTVVDFGGAIAKYVKITAHSNWGGLLTQYGLSEVRFLFIPVSAREPSPDPGATDMNVNGTLHWRAGREAATHDVYLSTDQQAVIDGTSPVVTVTDASYSPDLDLASMYYWRVDEVNEAEIPTTWKGDVWSFATQEYLVVEDFESYNDIPAGEEGSNLVYGAWVDGYENPTTNGSTIGYTEAFQPSMETSTVYDGRQSVPLFYNNTTASVSEVTANVGSLQAGRDWTRHGIRGLTLRFYGSLDNVPQQMYAKVNDAKLTYDGSADNLKRAGWQMWYIDLASLGTNLSNVATLTIGFERIGAVGGQGMVLLDGIRLYSYSRRLATPTDPGTNGLQAQYQFEGNANDSSGKGRNGTAMGEPFFVAGKVGQAISLDGLNDYVTITGYKGILADPSGTQQPFTITAWVKTIDSGDRTIASWGTDSDRLRVDFRLFEGRLRVEHGAGNVQGDTALNDDNWHHVALTMVQGATISYPDVQLWLDGKDNTRPSFDPDAFSVTAGVDMAIGYRATAAARYFLGAIDDVRLYDRVLTQEQIAWLAGLTTPFDKPF